MTGRVLAIARAALVEALRARLAPLGALLLLAAVPALALLFGENADTRAWLTRSLTSEGLRVVFPLASILGGGFLLKPALKRGWTVLPARRAEYFAGTALAGSAVLVLAAGLFALGGAVANHWLDQDLTLTRTPETISKQRVRDGVLQSAPGREDATTWVNPADGEELVAPLPALQGDTLHGTFEFQLAWTGEAPPQDRSPVAIWLQSAGTRTPLQTSVQSRYRIRFEGAWPGEGSLVMQPTDPVMIVGSSPERVRLEMERVSPWGSVARLFVLSCCAALLCLALVLLVRSLATAPTAVLAGLLLFTALTLLPSLAPTTRMARDRRAALERGAADATLVKQLEARVTDLPQLFPDVPFDEFLAARVVPEETWPAAAWRLLAGLALLPVGAAMFRLRQIAK
ncbi:MAG: hypothetical protein H6840_02160 [Planctomycetes bacterium]|nr:hypothetical protein [Planctomycetota bacterium]